jgi:integrase
MTTRARHDNHGLRKICTCPRRQWAKCDHPWHFNFKLKGGKPFRFSLDAHFGRHIDSKTEAEDLAADLRKAIRAGTFGQAAPVLASLTVGQLLDVYKTRYLAIERTASLTHLGYQIGTITRTVVAQPDGRRQAFGEWLMVDVTVDAIDQFKETRRARGLVGANRDLALLRAAFNWGIRTKHITDTPFKLGTETVVKLSTEHGRDRRLQDDEEAALLGASNPQLRAIVVAAIESGMRRGEILSLQWSQIDGMTLDGSATRWAPKAALVLPWGKTKTRRTRTVPISTRLRSVLDMRRLDPNGHPHAASAYVFGNAIGQRVAGFKRAWDRAVLRSHGHTPVYVKTNLAPASRTALAAIGLHFHDLRREAGSRWLDGGVPLHTIRDWLGHANIAQTSTYLSGTAQTQHDAMAAFEAHQHALQRIATEVGKGGQTTTQPITSHHEIPNKDAVGREPRIM